MSQVVLERGRVQRLFREQEDDSLISVSGHRKVCAGDAYTRVCAFLCTCVCLPARTALLVQVGAAALDVPGFRSTDSL